jgi:hypothetical protein
MTAAESTAPQAQAPCPNVSVADGNNPAAKCSATNKCDANGMLMHVRGDQGEGAISKVIGPAPVILMREQLVSKHGTTVGAQKYDNASFTSVQQNAPERVSHRQNLCTTAEKR